MMVVVSKTRKAFVGPRKGRDAEYNGARVRPSYANDTVSPGLSMPHCPRKLFHAASTSTSVVFAALCSAPVCVSMSVFANSPPRFSSCYIHLYADPRIIAVPRLSERTVNDTARIDKIYLWAEFVGISTLLRSAIIRFLPIRCFF